MYLYPDDVDKYLNWPVGKAARLARRGKLPHFVLPDGSIRFRLDEIETLIERIEMKMTPEPKEVAR